VCRGLYWCIPARIAPASPIAMWWGVVWGGVMWNGVLWCVVVWCGVWWCGAIAPPGTHGRVLPDPLLIRRALIAEFCLQLHEVGPLILAYPCLSVSVYICLCVSVSLCLCCSVSMCYTSQERTFATPKTAASRYSHECTRYPRAISRYTTQERQLAT
jgi:hypothetical protein